MKRRKVYLIECDNGFEKLFKIGYTSKKVEDRIRELSTANPGEFRNVIEYESKRASSLESYLHRHYSLQRIKNEWFRLSDEDIDIFKVLCEGYDKNIDFLEKSSNPYI